MPLGHFLSGSPPQPAQRRARPRGRIQPLQPGFPLHRPPAQHPRRRHQPQSPLRLAALPRPGWPPAPRQPAPPAPAWPGDRLPPAWHPAEPGRVPPSPGWSVRWQRLRAACRRRAPLRRPNQHGHPAHAARPAGAGRWNRCASCGLRRSPSWSGHERSSGEPVRSRPSSSAQACEPPVPAFFRDRRYRSYHSRRLGFRGRHQADPVQIPSYHCEIRRAGMPRASGDRQACQLEHGVNDASRGQRQHPIRLRSKPLPPARQVPARAACCTRPSEPSAACRSRPPFPARKNSRTFS